MGIPVVIKPSGGLPVSVSTNGYGMPMTVATNGMGLAVTQATGGGGLAVTGMTFGPTIALSASSVLETAAVNTVVGTLSVTAGTTGTPVFALVDSAGGKFNISGTSLRTNALLDYETATFHSITVSVTGVTPTVANATFIILVLDVVEPVILLTGTTVNENATAGTNIGVLSIANTFTGTPAYTLVDSSSGKVAISGSNLNVLGAIDYKTTPTFNITVSVSGITPVAPNKTFTVVVLDVAEAAYTGPGDIKAGALGWWGLRAYSAAQCTGSVAAIQVVKASDGSSPLDINILANGKLDVATISALGYAVKVNKIYDQSGNGRHLQAMNAAYVPTTAAAPDLTLAGMGGTLPCMTWSGGTQRLVNVAGFGAVAQPFTVSLIYNRTASAVFEALFAPDGITYGVFGNNAANGALMYAGAQLIAVAADGVDHSGQFVFNGASSNLYIDGTGTSGNPTTAGWQAGAITHGNCGPQGSIAGKTAEVGFWGSAFSAGDAAAMTTNQTNYLSGVGGGGTGVTKNIVTDYGAVGDAQWARTTLSITTNVLTSATAIWPSVTSGSEYIGKSIVVGRCGGTAGEAGGGTPLRTTITGWTSSTQITLGANCVMALSSEPNVIVAWGTNNGKQMPPNGVDATNGPFETFRLAYQGQAVTLTIPAGNYLISSGQFGFLFNGIRNITVNATGATICGGTFALGANNQSQWYGHSGFTASVSAGATSATLLTPAQVSRFAVGRYALMTGFGLQYGGYPSNHQLFEYVYVTAIDSDSGSPTYGKITFQAPLTNAYLSTWPLFLNETGTTPPPENGQYTSGGPATLYALTTDFNHTAVINNLTFAHHAQMGTAGLNLTLNGCVFESIYGPHATACKAVVFNNCLGIQCSMEVDKLITSFTMNGCDWGGLTFQSASVAEFIADDTDIRYSVVGSPLKATFRNGSTIGMVSGIGAFTPGCDYGYANELIVTSSQIKNFGAVTTHQSGYVIPGKDGSNNGMNVDYTMAGGVITVPIPNPLAYTEIYTTMWPVTNGKAFIQDAVTGEMIGALRITNATQSGGNALIATTLTGTWPSRSGHKLYLVKHPAPICTFTSVTGCPEVVDLSGAGAAGLPLYSYSKRTYDGSVAAADYWQVYGRVKKIVVAVTQAANGTTFPGAVTLAVNVNVGNSLIKMSDYTNTTWAPTINLKIVGTRTFDATAGTYPVSSWSGGQTGDVLPGMTEALWAPGNFRPTMTDTSAAAAGLRPIFSIEVITDQG